MFRSKKRACITKLPRRYQGRTAAYATREAGTTLEEQEDAEPADKADKRRDVILHPTRLRILTTLSPNRQLSAPQLSAALADVPPASLYRHLKILVEAGVVLAQDTNGARGATEKRYLLPSAQIALTPDDFADARPEDLTRYFTTFAGILLTHGTSFYSQNDLHTKPKGSYSMDALYLTEDEFQQLNAVLANLTALALNNQPSPERRRRVLFTALLPEVE